jgi:signal transduction histidine kinase
MRHNINNALTSVLGNAELVLLNTESFSGETRDQLETIRHTALRLHEIMQRFWSLEAEMQVIERSLPEAEKVGRAVGAGESR